MKNAPITNSNESALDKCDYTRGIFPMKINTIRADVLADLLDAQALKGMTSVLAQSTTRLSAVIHILGEKYHWPISRREVVDGTRDGRVSFVTEYWLEPAVIAAAVDQGAREWILSVRSARAHLRTRARRCKAIAERVNARRAAIEQDTNQSGDPKC
jgi:hypothetical protein